jgi:hypothetical protein
MAAARSPPASDPANKRTALAEGVHAIPVKPVLNGDNGPTVKCLSVKAMLNCATPTGFAASAGAEAAHALAFNPAHSMGADQKLQSADRKPAYRVKKRRQLS